MSFPENLPSTSLASSSSSALSPASFPSLEDQEIAYLEEIERLWTHLEQAQVSFSKPQWLLDKLQWWHSQKKQAYEAYKQPLEQGYKRVSDFLDYFRPNREGFLRRSINGHYYSPCQNNGHLALCFKAKPNYVYTGKNPCVKCKNRLAAPLEEGLVYLHLLGKNPKGHEGLAISPLQSDGTTSFVVLEVKEDSLASLQALRRTLAKAHFDSICVHDATKDHVFQLFLFFEGPIETSKAIDLAQMITTKAILEEGLLDFSIFDHIIPTIPAKKPGDLGRLVALPWDGFMTPQGSSLFLDEQLNPYPNQWQVLESSRKLSRAQIDAFLSQCTRNQYRQVFKPTLFTQETGYSYAASLFETTPRPNQIPLFPTQKGSLSLVLDQDIQIEASALDPALKARLLLMGCYWNPAYFQKSRFATGPRVICQSKQVGQFIKLPRGLLEELKMRLEASNIDYTLIDQRQTGTPLNLIFEGTLREEQEDLVQALNQKDCGILEAATGTGKTVMATALIARKKTSTLVLVNSKEILSGWVQTLNRFLRFENEEFEKPLSSKAYPGKIGVLQGKTNTLTKRIDVAMVPSLATKEDLEQLVAGYGLVLVDECHHAASSTMEKVLSHIHARFVYGLSATPERNDGFSESVCLQLGPVVSRFDSLQQMASQRFSRTYIPKLTSFVPFEVDADFLRLCQEAAIHPWRNALIVGDVLEALDQGKTVLVLTRFVDHAKLLAKWIQKADESAHVLVYAGNENPKEKQENAKKLKALANQSHVVLVGTISSIGEGFDFPALDTLMLALPMRSQISISQAIGRIHRQTQTKTNVQVFDYLDAHPMFQSMFEARQSEYQNQGYKALDAPSTTPYTPFSLQKLDHRQFRQAISQEFQRSHSIIALATRRLEEGDMAFLMHVLGQLDLKTLRVDLFLEEASDLQQEELAARGIYVHLHERIIERFVIFDKALVYYGSLFGQDQEQEGYRLQDEDFAHHLLQARRIAEIEKVKTLRAQGLGQEAL